MSVSYSTGLAARRLRPAVSPPATEGGSGATYRRGGGGRQERQDASAGDDDVVHHLRNEVDRVVDEDDVLIAVDEIHHRLGGVTEMENKKSFLTDGTRQRVWKQDTAVQAV